LSKIKYERQKALNAIYKNNNVGDFRVDLVIEDKVVIELKSVERHDLIFEAQILSYMKLGGYKLGLLININSKLLTEGVKRFKI
jgi:GxxExxY protein